MPSPSEPRAAVLAVDRIACTGHGVCAHLLPEQITLDEWGYPVTDASATPGGADTALAITMCPARALYLTATPPRRGR